MIRVGRLKYEYKKRISPEYKDYSPILVLTKSSPYGSLGPYMLFDNRGYNMENIWQFSKCYKKVPRSKQRYSRWDSRIIWEHPAETHIIETDDEYEFTDEWLNWREKGMNAPYAIRYPVGYNNRHKVMFALAEKKNGEIDYENPLDYIEARKVIYLPLYTKLVKEQRQFHELKERLQQGENLLLIEVDGPHQESLDYYKEKYGVDDTFIEQDTMLATEDNLKIMLEDPKHPFGHGYCLAAALLDINL